MTILKSRPELLPANVEPDFQIIERDGKLFIDEDDISDLVDYAQKIDESRGKHDCSWSTYLINIGGHLYAFDVEYSYGDGLNPGGGDVELDPVEIVPSPGWVVRSIKKT